MGPKSRTEAGKRKEAWHSLSSTGFICLSAQLALFGWTQKTLEGNFDSNVLFAQLIIWVSQKVGENNDFPSSGSWTSLVPLFCLGVRTQGRGAICFGLKLNLPKDTDRCSDQRPGRLLFQCLVKFSSLGFSSRLQTKNMHFSCSNCLFLSFQIGSIVQEKEITLCPRTAALLSNEAFSCFLGR